MATMVMENGPVTYQPPGCEPCGRCGRPTHLTGESLRICFHCDRRQLQARPVEQVMATPKPLPEILPEALHCDGSRPGRDEEGDLGTSHKGRMVKRLFRGAKLVCPQCFSEGGVVYVATAAPEPKAAVAPAPQENTQPPAPAPAAVTNSGGKQSPSANQRPRKR